MARLTDLVAWRLSRPPAVTTWRGPTWSRALVELAAQLGVYRTYVDASGATARTGAGCGRPRPGPGPIWTGTGRGPWTWFSRCWRRRAPTPLGLPRPSARSGGLEPGRLELVQRWQQHTGAVTAKGVEDTALYRWRGLAALTEVGTDPGRPPVTVDRFHQAMAGVAATAAARCRPPPPTTPSERGRQIPAGRAVRAARHLGGACDPMAPMAPVAGRHSRSPDELFAYQTIVGAWPLDPDDRRGFSRRVQDYMVKALREEKVRTSWLRPDEDYERVVRSFVGTVLAPSNRRFRADLGRLLEAVGPAGAANALAMTVLKCTVPGVPDLYQGTELWSHSLVDPDNRRPVDFDRRARWLTRSGSGDRR